MSERELKGLRKDGQRFVRQVRKLRNKHKDKLEKAKLETLDTLLVSAEKALETANVADLTKALKDLDEAVEKNLGKWRKSTVREYVEAILLAVTFALLLRAFLVEAFIIPSASMEPTLQEGDRLFVNKFVYGLRIPFTTKKFFSGAMPDRGDVVVFVFPKDEARQHTATLPPHRRSCVDPGSLRDEKDYIKRVVGLPGDTIKMVNNQLIVNGDKVPTEVLKRKEKHPHNFPFVTQQTETVGEKSYVTQHYGTDANFALDKPITVKEGHVFVMGDNRDNSSDGRCWGQVPLDNLKGKAMIIWYSSDGRGVHGERIGQFIE